MDTLEIAVPKNLETMQLPDPSLVNYWRLAESRSYYIDYDIDASLLEIQRAIIIANIEDKGKSVEERTPIKLWIFSYGGELDAVYAVISAIELSKTPVITINAGVAMSAGLLLLLAGHKRYAFNRSTALIHSGSGMSVGTYEQIAERQKQYDSTVKIMREYILSRTNITPKKFGAKKSTDWYVSDREQVELGIVDGMLTSFGDVI